MRIPLKGVYRQPVVSFTSSPISKCVIIHVNMISAHNIYNFFFCDIFKKNQLSSNIPLDTIFLLLLLEQLKLRDS